MSKVIKHKKKIALLLIQHLESKLPNHLKHEFDCLVSLLMMDDAFLVDNEHKYDYWISLVELAGNND